MQLQEQYPDRLHAISLNVDFNDSEGVPPAELKHQVATLLSKMDVACENVLCSDPMDDVLRELDLFSLPAAIIYDAQGKLHRRFDGDVDYAEGILPAVAELLTSS